MATIAKIKGVTPANMMLIWRADIVRCEQIKNEKDSFEIEGEDPHVDYDFVVNDDLCERYRLYYKIREMPHIEPHLDVYWIEEENSWITNVVVCSENFPHEFRAEAMQLFMHYDPVEQRLYDVKEMTIN